MQYILFTAYIQNNILMFCTWSFSFQGTDHIYAFMYLFIYTEDKEISK